METGDGRRVPRWWGLLVLLFTGGAPVLRGVVPAGRAWCGVSARAETPSLAAVDSRGRERGHSGAVSGVGGAGRTLSCGYLGLRMGSGGELEGLDVGDAGAAG